MNIMYFSNSTSGQGGAELNLLKISKYFDGKFNVNIILPDDNGIYKTYKEEGINPIVINSIRPSSKSGIMNLLKFIIFFPITVLKLVRIINQKKIDIVHTNDIIDFPAMVAAKFTKAKLVSHLRFIIKEEGIQKKLFNKIYLTCADQIICVSKAVKNNWFPYESKALVVYDGGPDLEVFTRKEERVNSSDFLHIITVGKLVNISGHENIIEAISNLDNDIQKNVKLSIVGGSVEGHEEYEKMLKNLVIDKKVSVDFVGYTDKVYEHLRNADLFSFTPTWEHSFPNVVLEAMAMNLPILAFNKGGIGEQVDHGINGYLVDNVKELQRKIEQFYYDRDLMKDFSRNSLKVLKQNFSLKQQLSDIEKIYISLME